MTKKIETLAGRVLTLPTDEDVARIRAGIGADPDTHEVSEEEFRLMRRPGWPLGSGTKTQITLCLDTEHRGEVQGSRRGLANPDQ
jgi:hypothetical protein